MHIALLAR